MCADMADTEFCVLSFSNITECCIWGSDTWYAGLFCWEMGFWSCWKPGSSECPEKYHYHYSPILFSYISTSGWNNKVWCCFFYFIFLVTQKSPGYCSCSMKLLCLSKSLLLAAMKLRLSAAMTECRVLYLQAYMQGYVCPWVMDSAVFRILCSGANPLGIPPAIDSNETFQTQWSSIFCQVFVLPGICNQL